MNYDSMILIYQIGVIDISNKHYRFYFLNKNMLLTTISETSNNTNSVDGDISFNSDMFDKEDIALFNPDDYEEEPEYEEEDNALTLQDG